MRWEQNAPEMCQESYKSYQSIGAFYSLSNQSNCPHFLTTCRVHIPTTSATLFLNPDPQPDFDTFTVSPHMQSVLPQTKACTTFH